MFASIQIELLSKLGILKGFCFRKTKVDVSHMKNPVIIIYFIQKKGDTYIFF